MTVITAPDLTTAIKTKLEQGGYTFISSYSLEVKEIPNTKDSGGGFESLLVHCGDIVGPRTLPVAEKHENIGVVLPFPAIITHMNRYWLIIPQGETSTVYGLIRFNDNTFNVKPKYGRDVVSIFEDTVKIGIAGDVSIVAPAAK